MRQILRTVLMPFPRVKAWLRIFANRLDWAGSVSAHYSAIEHGRVAGETQRLRSSWQDRDLPRRQRALVDRQLADFRLGRPVDVFNVFAQAVKATGLENGSLLEVGCSSGFYAEVLAIRCPRFSYTGCDYSSAFIDLARQRHPGLPFCVGDATQLEFQDSEFDIVVSGCCLLHIPEFDKAIAETARVARGWAIFHRTPVVVGLPDQYYRKRAYGVETIEIHFNEEQLLARFTQHGLETVQVFTLDENRDAGSNGVWRYNRTYLCKKIQHA